MDLVEFLAHLLPGLYHARALVTGRELSLVATVGHPRRERRYVEVGLLPILNVIERYPPRHIAVRCQLTRRLVHMNVAIHDEDVLDALLAFPLAFSYCSLRHSNAPFLRHRSLPPIVPTISTILILSYYCRC